MKKTLILLILLSVVSVLSAYEIPFIMKGVRPMGMGGAFTAVADDQNSLFYNTAGLALYEKRSVTIQGDYTEQTFKGLVFENYLKTGADILYAQKYFGGYLSYSLEGNPKCEACDATYEKTDNLFEMKLAVANKVDDHIALGVDFKFSNLFNWKNTRTDAYSLSASALVHFNEYFDAGIQAQSVFYFSKYIYRLWSYGGEPLGYTNVTPCNINLGIAVRPAPGVIFALDIKNLLEPEAISKYIAGDSLDHVDSVFYTRTYNIGAEYALFDWLTLRAGSYYTSYPINFSFHILPGQSTDKYITAATVGASMEFEGLRSDIAVIDEFRGAGNIFEPLKYYLSTTYFF